MRQNGSKDTNEQAEPALLFEESIQLKRCLASDKRVNHQGCPSDTNGSQNLTTSLTGAQPGP